MLVRFIVKNLFSFKEQTEFNLLPGRVKRLSHHKYALPNGIEVLKLSALYGANGSGKSNLIKAISLLKTMLINGSIPNALLGGTFKLSESTKKLPTELAIEFFTGGELYYYSVAIQKGIFKEEYFSRIDADREDNLIFHRKPDGTIQFSTEFERDPEYPTLKRVIEKDFLTQDTSLFNLLNRISSSKHFVAIQDAYYWFKHRLSVIRPDTGPDYLIDEFANNEKFSALANELMQAFSTGIENMTVEEMNLDDVLNRDNQAEISEIMRRLNDKPGGLPQRMIHPETREEIIIREDGQVVRRRLALEHKDEKGKLVKFGMNDESDGTQRLIEYLPALTDVVHSDNVYLIDEIERSIHPNIIVALVEKFSKDEQTKGQLIFSTHETNLLNQGFLRTDEIWITEKNLQGASTIYSLSDFKEHNTIDIQKGYLTGRYGGIPFLGDLEQLNWHTREDKAS